MFGALRALLPSNRERARRILLALGPEHGHLPPDELRAAEHLRLQLCREALHGITTGAQAHALRAARGICGGLFISRWARAAFIGLPPARRAAVRRVPGAVPRAVAGGFGDGGGAELRRLTSAALVYLSKSMCYQYVPQKNGFV